MPARAAWKGFLNIHQLQVPVKAFTAVSSQPEIALNQLHLGCGARVRQLKVCPIHGELTAAEIGAGYEFAEGQYLPLAADELQSLQAADTKEIAVDCFVAPETIDAAYHSGRTYYVVPDGPPGQRPFQVVRAGLLQSGRIGVSRLVINHREQLVLLRPLGRLLALTVLEYPQRVRSPDEYAGEVTDVAISPREQELALQLIGALTPTEFDLSRYRDRYIDGLSDLIERKLADSSREVLPAAAGVASDGADAEDDAALVAALRASLTAAGVDDLPARLPSRTDRTPTRPEESPVPKIA